MRKILESKLRSRNLSKGKNTGVVTLGSIFKLEQRRTNRPKDEKANND